MVSALGSKTEPKEESSESEEVVDNSDLTSVDEPSIIEEESVLCYDCHGTGLVKNNTKTCTECSGKGRKKVAKSPYLAKE